MVVLKKIKGSTLMETLVATVLIVIVFLVASLLMNSIFQNTVRNSTTALEDRLTEIQYQWHHGAVPPDYGEEWGDWEILLRRQQGRAGEQIVLRAVHLETDETVIRILGDD